MGAKLSEQPDGAFAWIMVHADVAKVSQRTEQQEKQAHLQLKTTLFDMSGTPKTVDSEDRHNGEVWVAAVILMLPDLRSRRSRSATPLLRLGVVHPECYLMRGIMSAVDCIGR